MYFQKGAVCILVRTQAATKLIQAIIQIWNWAGQVGRNRMIFIWDGEIRWGLCGGTTKLRRKQLLMQVGIYSDYLFNVQEEVGTNEGQAANEGAYRLHYKSGIENVGVKLDIEHNQNPRHEARIGAKLNSLVFTPGMMVYNTEEQAYGNDTTFQNPKIRTYEGYFILRRQYGHVPKFENELGYWGFRVLDRKYFLPPLFSPAFPPC